MPWLFSTKYTHIIAGIGFLFFGGLMLYEAYLNKEDPEEEKELEEEIKKIDEKLLRSNSGHDIELQEKTFPSDTVVQKTTEAAAPRLEHRLI
jgi:putative Ca2+/H+ antiporter (TMEM165/GDT1 family)